MQKTKDAKIDYKDGWANNHLKTLQSAYSSSPFYEFYIDDLIANFEKKWTYILDLNFHCHEFVMDALQLTKPIAKTDEYKLETSFKDHRNLAIAKLKTNYNLSPYHQVFSQNHGFISNLSILDLIFMEGPNALNYLESQTVKF